MMNNELILNENNSYEIINEIILYLNRILKRIDEIKTLIEDLEINKIWVCENANYFQKKSISKLNDMQQECYLMINSMKQMLNNISNIQKVDQNIIKALNGDLNL